MHHHPLVPEFDPERGKMIVNTSTESKKNCLKTQIGMIMPIISIKERSKRLNFPGSG